jgi:Flp pilus assembly pilin Flp
MFGFSGNGLRRKLKRAQGMTEYIIIVAVIAILSIGIITKFGDQIREFFSHSGEKMVGDTGTVDNKMNGETVDKSLADF